VLVSAGRALLLLHPVQNIKQRLFGEIQLNDIDPQAIEI
jgi:hypothetical protein